MYIMEFYLLFVFHRFDEMMKWMDQVDNTLRTIFKEVNCADEFETEKLIFQVSQIFEKYSIL